MGKKDSLTSTSSIQFKQMTYLMDVKKMLVDPVVGK
jgi:hypothetical protein